MLIQGHLYWLLQAGRSQNLQPMHTYTKKVASIHGTEQGITRNTCKLDATCCLLSTQVDTSGSIQATPQQQQQQYCTKTAADTSAATKNKAPGKTRYKYMQI